MIANLHSDFRVGLPWRLVGTWAFVFWPVPTSGAQPETCATIFLSADRKARGTYGALTAFADLVDDPDKAARLIALRDKIFQQGLSVVRWSYVDEAGEVELVEARLTVQDRNFLKQLPYPGGKLLEAHEARIAAARKLGDLERKKQDLIRTHESKAGKIALSDVAKACNGWIRTVRAFVGILDLEKNLAPDVRQKILGPLEEAERKTAKRGGKENGDERTNSDPENTSNQ